MSNGESFGWGLIDGVALARVLRPACTDCGRAGLRYGHVSALMVHVTPVQRQAFAEGMEWLGASVNGDPIGWACTCGGLGIFADIEAEMGPF